MGTRCKRLNIPTSQNVWNHHRFLVSSNLRSSGTEPAPVREQVYDETDILPSVLGYIADRYQDTLLLTNMVQTVVGHTASLHGCTSR